MRVFLLRITPQGHSFARRTTVSHGDHVDDVHGAGAIERSLLSLLVFCRASFPLSLKEDSLYQKAVSEAHGLFGLPQQERSAQIGMILFHCGSCRLASLCGSWAGGSGFASGPVICCVVSLLMGCLSVPFKLVLS